MRGWLRVAPPIIILMAIGMYCAFPHPTRDNATLKAVADEAQHLIAVHQIRPDMQPVEIPRNRWPPAIASLEPSSVTVSTNMVDITTKPHFDGGWGYGFAADKQSLTMVSNCWSHLNYDVYWHEPC